MIFIAGDWTNIDNKEKFDNAEKQLFETEKYHQIYGTKYTVNLFTLLNETVPNLSDKKQLDLALYVLSMCDMIYMLKGWENNNDIRLLHDYADANGYKIIYSKKF
jgi:hypothetical protein